MFVCCVLLLAFVGSVFALARTHAASFVRAMGMVVKHFFELVCLFGGWACVREKHAVGTLSSTHHAADADCSLGFEGIHVECIRCREVNNIPCSLASVTGVGCTRYLSITDAIFRTSPHQQRTPPSPKPPPIPPPPRINDGLVEKASEYGDDSEEAKPYLCALLTASGVLYTGSLCAIGAMFHYFQGCAENELVMSLTLILSVVSLPSEAGLLL